MIEVIKIALDIYFIGVLVLKLYEKYLKVEMLRLELLKKKSELENKEK